MSTERWHVPTGGPYLAPHPWDALGKPPKPGIEYQPPTDYDAALAMAEKLRKADDLYTECEDLKADARSLENDADELREQAEKDRETVNWDALANAIDSEPRRFKTAEDIDAWTRGER